MTTTVLLACAVLTAVLAAYALGHYFCTAVFLVARRRPPAFNGHNDASVTVLVPARHEGGAAVRAIRSLLDQDHPGALDIVLLLKDRADSSLPFVEAAFPHAQLGNQGEVLVEVTRDGDRRVLVGFTDHDNKSHKINWMAKRLESDYAAILDCDHQAHPDWLRTSLALLAQKGARIAQGRRSSLFAGRLFRLWDALHQHVGCELFNEAFSRLGLTVFFTGTTVVMEAALMKAHPFRRCLTEDADFSYQVVLDGERIIHNPIAGSDEDLSPNLYSFLARRRRWASGHTEAFLRHIGRLRSSPLRLAARVQFLFHGLHYLICLPVFALHLVIGVVLAVGLAWNVTLEVVLLSLLLATLIARTQQTSGWAAKLTEVAVLAAWLAPASIILTNAGVAWAEQDFTRTALAIPGWLQLLGLFGFAAPLIVLVAGLARFRQLTPMTALVVLATFPLAFYLDIAGVLLGITDFATGQRRWRPVARTTPSPAPARSQGTVEMITALDIARSWRLGVQLGPIHAWLARAMAPLTRPARWAPWLTVSGLLLGGVFCSPSQIEIVDAGCEVLQHDGEPWIVPPERLHGYCDPAGSLTESRWTRRTGAFEVVRHDELTQVDPAFWDRLDSTFKCNLSHFAPENVVLRDDGGISLRLEARAKNDRAVTAGSIATKDADEARYLYGRFETVMKPAKISGVISAFFLYRFDPWQEIDAEFLGRDTSKLLANVYYNPGVEGDLYNYGFAGTPVLVDLGFDAAEDFHRYAIEWEPGEIRWFVDGRLLHSRPAGRPTPVPHLPMRLHVNTWPTCGESLAGPFSTDGLPKATDVRSVEISTWEPSRLAKLAAYVGSVFAGDDDPHDWRDSATWVQPGR